ncbi:MAG TPA: DUF882 domain-containing protein [Alphaproteobacteria bacterium]|nr:DUF882 domain-containing protein [Alphaproteobacteria bacterium]
MWEPTNPGRRRFVCAGVAAVFSAVAAPAFAAIPRHQVRTVSFDNLHTGERLKVDYWVNGRYLPDAMGAVEQVLRDHRTNEVHAIDPQLLDLLDALSRRLYTRVPYQVISGYRSPATNAMLRAQSDGVAAQSLHMEGMAIDIRVPGRTLRAVHKAALQLERGGVGYYPRSDFVHVDVGRVRRW